MVSGLQAGLYLAYDSCWRNMGLDSLGSSMSADGEYPYFMTRGAFANCASLTFVDLHLRLFPMDWGKPRPTAEEQAELDEYSKDLFVPEKDTLRKSRLALGTYPDWLKRHWFNDPRFLDLPRTYNVNMTIDKQGKMRVGYLEWVHLPPAGNMGFATCEVADPMGENIRSRFLAEVRTTLLQQIQHGEPMHAPPGTALRELLITSDAKVTDGNEQEAFADPMAELLHLTLQSLNNKNNLALPTPDRAAKPMKPRKLLSSMGLSKLNALKPTDFRLWVNVSIEEFRCVPRQVRPYSIPGMDLLTQKKVEFLGFQHRNGTTFWVEFDALMQQIQPVRVEGLPSYPSLIEDALWKQWVD